MIFKSAFLVVIVLVRKRTNQQAILKHGALGGLEENAVAIIIILDQVSS